MRCETVVLVENLDVCRYFYRNTLALGEPVLDSNFQVVFALSEEAFLVLEKCRLPYLEHTCSACRLALEVSDIAGLAEKLAKEGNPVDAAFYRGNRKAIRTNDPEGNVIVLISNEL